MTIPALTWDSGRFSTIHSPYYFPLEIFFSES